MINNIRKSITIIISALVLLLAVGCGKQEAPPEPKLNEIKQICELSTLECFYHGVAKSKMDYKLLNAIGINNPRIWIEFDAEVELGVDMSKAKLDVDGNTVTVSLPDAKVLHVDIDDDSYDEENIIAEALLLKKLKPGNKEMNKAIKDAREDLETLAAGSTDQLKAARNRAEKLIENYINEIGAASGVTYNVKFETLK